MRSGVEHSRWRDTAKSLTLFKYLIKINLHVASVAGTPSQLNLRQSSPIPIGRPTKALRLGRNYGRR
jgi:hypothetical protein